MDRCANAFMAVEGQTSSTSKEKENKIPTPPSSPINRPPKGLRIEDIPTPPNMTRYLEINIRVIHPLFSIINFSYT